MKKTIAKKQAKAHIVMILLLFVWATGYIAAKYAQMTFPTGSLIFLKYIVGLVVVFIIKHFVDPNGSFKKRTT